MQENIKTKKGIKEVEMHNDVPQKDTSSKEEWEESGNSDDDIDYTGADIPDIEIHEADDLKPGDFILVELGTGKRMSTTFRYLCCNSFNNCFRYRVADTMSTKYILTNQKPNSIT
ncbi:unnamed protein product [Ceutorhynchus assimilis]|uniref:Uncharacterized protein n=1 Tax=Ceutorhynchus assimilis TaxID=467358 RepID=A0A9N9QNU4_9CUCU|nr:unnamed protein product [Ceutorhynchus assimilis]